MSFSGIYEIQSQIKPGRAYIGSAKNISDRWRCHLKDLRKGIHGNSKLQNHFNKYGESDLQFSVLIGCNKEDLLKNEQFFIDSYNPFFNICKKAGSCMGIKRSEAFCKKLSERMKGKFAGEKHPMFGRHYSEEHCKKLSESHKGLNIGEKNPMFGKNRKGLNKGIKRSDLTRKKISDSKRKYYMDGHTPYNKGLKMSEEQKMKLRGRIMSEEQKRKISERKSVSILQYDLNGNMITEWDSIIKAAHTLRICKNGISNALTGRVHKAGGFKWEYKKIA